MTKLDRRWVYAGLGAVTAGVGLLRALRQRPRLHPDSRILVVGDSFAVGLTPPLRALAKEAGLPFDSVALQGTRIDQWAVSAALDEKLRKFKPSLVLVSLGTNDEYLRGDGGTMQAPHLDRLLAKLRTVGDFVWIGPPKLPKRATNGVIPLLRSRLDDDHYFPSQTLNLPRGPDALHPTARGYAGWAGALWQWLS